MLLPGVLGHGRQIEAIGRIGEAGSNSQKLLGIDESAAIGDFLDAGDHQALAVLDGADELRRIQQKSGVPVSNHAKLRPMWSQVRVPSAR